MRFNIAPSLSAIRLFSSPAWREGLAEEVKMACEYAENVYSFMVASQSVHAGFDE
jgi:hypothetical protein